MAVSQARITVNEDRPKWLNQGQPQTLVIATLLLYINAFFGILNAFLGGASLLFLAIVVAQGLGGFGIANEKKWGYNVAVVASVLSLALLVFIVTASLGIGGLFSINILFTLIFDIALVALLVHPQSREYTKIWFR